MSTVPPDDAEAPEAPTTPDAVPAPEPEAPDAATSVDAAEAPEAAPPVVDVDPQEAELEPLPDHLRYRPDRPQEPGSQNRSQNRLILLLFFGLIPMILVFVVVLNSLSTGPPAPDQSGSTSGLNEVTRYCVYTAKSNADYDDCLNRTDERVVAKENSNAARYARGQLLKCLPDSGYRCTLK